MTTLRNWLFRALTSLGAFFAVINVASAATATPSGGAVPLDTLGTFLLQIIYFIDTYLVPVIFSIAFIVFLWGLFQYFIAGAANEEKRKEGQQFAMWGFIGFFLMISVWGVVNLLIGSLGFGSTQRPNLPTFGSPTAQQSQSGGTINPGGQAHNCPGGSTWVESYGPSSIPTCVSLTTGQPVN